ncbi:MAG: PKD domain-containing protein [Vicingaceae bacterium]|nr:PKD domain-containing protein [Vicingaceae bacterium]
MKKLKHLLIIFFLMLTFKGVYGHSVQVVYCTDCSGTVRVFVEHWHPASEPLLNAAMTFNVTYGTIINTVTKLPVDTIFNVPKNALPNCSTTPTTFGFCPSDANTYNDWLIYEFSGIPNNSLFAVDVVYSNDIIASDMCGMLPASTGTLLINNNTQVHDTLTICQGDSSLIFGNYQSTSGTYYDSLQTVNGCDSILATTLTVTPTYFSNNFGTICQGDSILIGGTYQSIAGTYYDSLQTVSGCDSILATTLTVTPTYFSNNFGTICQGDSILIGGTYQSVAGTYYDSLQTVNGCDSILATTLTVTPTYFSNNFGTICQGDSILIGGTYQSIAGTYYDSLQTVSGCDSILATILSIDTSLTANFTKIIDPNDSLNLLVTNLASGNNLQYLWDFGDGNTSTQAHPTHIYATIGVYNLCLTITDSITGCSSMFCDSTTVMRTTGIKTIEVVSTNVGIAEIVNFDKMKLFPNPTQHTFILDLGETQEAQVLVTSIEGKMMYNKVITNNIVVIDASKWTNGFYLVNVIIDNQHKVFKLVKQ